MRNLAAANDVASNKFDTCDEFGADEATPAASSHVPKTEGQALGLARDAFAAYKASHALARSAEPGIVTSSDKVDHVIKRKAFVQALLTYSKLKKKG